jgi:hypothetical protein
MSNDNSLAGVQYPQCGNEDHSYIETSVFAYVTDDGAEMAQHTDMEWDDASITRCPDCERDGPLSEFRAQQTEKGIKA